MVVSVRAQPGQAETGFDGRAAAGIAGTVGEGEEEKRRRVILVLVSGVVGPPTKAGGYLGGIGRRGGWWDFYRSLTVPTSSLSSLASSAWILSQSTMSAAS